MRETLSRERENVSPDSIFEAGLVRAAKRGHREAYDQLVRLHLAGAYGVATRIVGSPDDAEDVVQEAFLKAYQALGSFKEGAAFSTWLYRIVVNAGLDFVRRRQRRSGILRLFESREPQQAAPTSHRPESEAFQAELGHLVDRAIDHLPFRMRTALVLRVVEGHPYDDIARVLGTTATTCRVYVTQARKRLHQALGRAISP